MDYLDQQLLAHRVALVVSWSACLFLLLDIDKVAVLGASAADTARICLLVVLVALALFMCLQKADTVCWVPEHALELATHGLHVERRKVAPIGRGCCGGQGLYLYIYPISLIN
jgi:hypothetical protein